MQAISYAITLAQLQWAARHRRECFRNGGLVFIRWGIFGGSAYITFR